jgi:hypothetical protein
MIKPGPQQKGGAPYVGQTTGGSTPDVAAAWEESFYPGEWREFTYPNPTNAIYTNIPQICNGAMDFTFSATGFFWVQSHIPKLFTGSTCSMRLSFYQNGGWTGNQTFTFKFGARAWASASVFDQTVSFVNQNVTINPATGTDRIWYVDSPIINIEGSVAPGNFIYLKFGRQDLTDGRTPYGVALSVSYPLSVSYSL